MCDFFMSALKKWFFNANALVLPCYLNVDDKNCRIYSNGDYCCRQVVNGWLMKWFVLEKINGRIFGDFNFFLLFCRGKSLTILYLKHYEEIILDTSCSHDTDAVELLDNGTRNYISYWFYR